MIERKIAFDTKERIELEVLKLVNDYKNIDFVEAITIRYFYNYDGKATIGLTIVCDTFNNSNLLKSKRNNSLINIDDINIELSYSNYRKETTERRMFFKDSNILIDKRNYKDIQKNIENNAYDMCNEIEFTPKLKIK